MATMTDHWSTEKYTAAASFVPLLTTKVFSLLSPQPTDTILDIGCGDGTLTASIAPHCTHITGVDASLSFIQSALKAVQSVHSNADFIVADCRRLDPALDVFRRRRYDKVFSNAAMHWILRDERTRVGFFKDVFGVLKGSGVFVFEMGGHGNVGEVHAALIAVLRFKFGVKMERIRGEGDPWFFPSPDWMRMTLENAGFVVDVAELEERPTKCTPKAEDGSGGLEGWVRLMGATFLELLEPKERELAVRDVCEVLEPIGTRIEDGSQWLGYVRLRVRAVKP